MKLLNLAAAIFVCALLSACDSPPAAATRTVGAASEPTVVEFFSYMCPHCSDFEPILQRWSQSPQFPAGAQLVRSPAVFNADYETAARLYMALLASGQWSERVHSGIFEAVHKRGLRLADREALASTLSALGADAKKVLVEMDSPAVAQQVAAAKALQKEKQISSVPQLVVGGKIAVNGQTPGGFEGMLRAAEEAWKSAKK